MIYIGSDHGGFSLKEKIKNHLLSKNMELKDFGTHSLDSCDYPDIAQALSEAVASDDAVGILVCGTGIGMSISANKVSGIRAALCWSEYTAEMSRRHNNANILCLGGRVLEPDLALMMTDIFLSTKFDGGRHERRVKKIMSYKC